MSISPKIFIPASNSRDRQILFPEPFPSLPFRKPLSIQCAKKAKRTGKLRYPSEKKKLKLKQLDQNDVRDKFKGFWRLSKLEVPVHRDPGKDFLGVSDALLEEIAKVLEFPVASMLPVEAFFVIRKSFDARKFQKEPKFVYTVQMDINKLLSLEPRTWDFISRLSPIIGVIEHIPYEKDSGDVISIIYDNRRRINGITGSNEDGCVNNLIGSRKVLDTSKPKVAVIGSGPSGLFASLVLAEFGAEVALIERGQAVEQRGRDIGALIVRRVLQLESNFCFGEVLGVMAS